MTGPVLLVVSNAPAREDDRAGADWHMILAAISWAEGHGYCGGLTPGPDPDGTVVACPCGDSRLVFEIGDPMPESEAAA